jgi:hypothetical protein
MRYVGSLFLYDHLCKHPPAHTCRSQELQRVVSRCLDLLGSSSGTAPFGLHADMDYYLVIKTMESQLLEWHGEYAITTGIGRPRQARSNLINVAH